MEITRPPRKFVTEYSLDIRHVRNGSGWSLACTQDGTLLEPECPEQVQSRFAALEGLCKGTHVFRGIQQWHRDITPCPQGPCDECGHTVHFPNDGSYSYQCERCSAEYNGFGQRLAQRWRETCTEPLEPEY